MEGQGGNGGRGPQQWKRKSPEKGGGWGVGKDYRENHEDPERSPRSHVFFIKGPGTREQWETVPKVPHPHSAKGNSSTRTSSNCLFFPQNPPDKGRAFVHLCQACPSPAPDLTQHFSLGETCKAALCSPHISLSLLTVFIYLWNKSHLQ